MTIRHRRPAHSRLAALEQARKNNTPAAIVAPQMAEEEWRDAFREFEAEGRYAGFPEYAEAIAALELALSNATEYHLPPFIPPTEYLPLETDVVRRQQWRAGKRYPAVAAAMDQMLLLTERAVELWKAQEEGRDQ